MDAVTDKPVPGAIVALQDKNNRVIAWTKTDNDGNYVIAADTLSTLGLRPSRRRGLLANLARGVGQVVSAPVKLAANVVKQVDPVGTTKAAVVSAVTSNPAPVAAKIVGQAANTVSDQAERKARETAAKSVLGERQQAAPTKEKRDEVVPGEVRLAVSAPGFGDAKGKAGAYWMEPADEPAKSETKEQAARRVGVRAWLETVRLAPSANAGDKKSEVENMAVLLANPRLEPSLVPAGAPVHVEVSLQTPPPPPGRNFAQSVRVFAREDKSRAVVELKPKPDAAGVYAGDLALDPKTGAGETTITLVALRAAPIEVNLRESQADPLLDFARRLDDLDPDQPYDFDPRIAASENRLDLKLTILDPQQNTPATVAPPTPAPTPAPATPAPAAPAPKP